MDFTAFNPEDFLMEPSFQRYCSGENETDALFWDNWIRQHPEKLSSFNEAKKLFAVLQGQKGRLQEESAHFMALFDSHAGNLPEEHETGEQLSEEWYVNSRGLLRRKLLIIAGVLSACLLLAGGIWLFKSRIPSVPRPQATASVPLTYTAYSCDLGTRKKITLADGSTVILNSNSTIRVPDNFNQHSRQVLLDGAAFFEVVHNVQKPFTVHARNLATVDIGTSFLVRAYDYEPDIKVLLLTGKVKVETHSNDQTGTVSHNIIELAPGEKLTLNKATDQLQTASFDASFLESWKTGRLSFNNASFDEVMQQLEMWYGVRFKVTGNQYKSKHFTGQFDNEQLDDVLKVISFSMDCRCHREENTVFFKFR